MLGGHGQHDHCEQFIQCAPGYFSTHPRLPVQAQHGSAVSMYCASKQAIQVIVAAHDRTSHPLPSPTLV